MAALASAIVLGQQPEPAPAAGGPVLPPHQVWLATLPEVPAAAGALDGQRVYVPLRTQGLVALDRESGRTEWTRDLVSAWIPLAAGGVLHVAAGDEAHALDPATGGTRWRTHLGAAVVAPPVLAGDLLVLAVGTHTLVALRAAGGQRVWSRDLDGRVGPGAVVAHGDALYVAAQDGRVLALSREDGQVRWVQTVEGTLTPPVVAGGRVLVGSTTRRLYALDTRSGRLLWRWRVGGDVVGAAADDDMVYVVSLDNMLRGLDRRSGNQRWLQGLPTRPVAPPQVIGGSVVVAGVAPTVMTFAAETGAPTGSYTAPAPPAAPPPVLAGAPLIGSGVSPVAMVVVLRDGQVVGLGAALK